MPKRLLSHLRGNAVAYIALFAALGGTGYAANKIGTKQLKLNAVTKPKIAPNAVDGSKVQNASLTNADLGAVNAAQLGGLSPDEVGSGVVMGRINALQNSTLTQFASPAGITQGPLTTPSGAVANFITIPDQVIRDFTISDQDLTALPTTEDLNIRIIYQGSTIGSCTIGPGQAPSCSIPTAVIGNTGVNSLHLEVQAENAAAATFYQNDDLLFAYRMTPSP